MSNQNHVPIREAIENFLAERVVPFDVPGHKRGRGDPELTAFFGQRAMSLDMNGMKPLDYLCHPVSVIKEAEELAADAFGASAAFFITGGTTAAVQAMVFSAVHKGDKLILPRNVHQSVINALILCGGIPVYVSPGGDKQLGISLCPTVSDMEAAIKANPDAKAVLVNNPTYYGVCGDVRSIAEKAHSAGMKLLSDEAHGTHLYFGEDLPPAAIKNGADLAAVSMHKSGGSLTQSSMLLAGDGARREHIRQYINLTQTTSGSYLLLSSLDIARRNLAINGRDIFRKVLSLAEYARREINAIGDYYAFAGEKIDGGNVFAFDRTKLSVHTIEVGLAGIEVYDILRDEYDIQAEFGDLGNILAYISVGDREQDIERLVGALKEIRRRFKKPKTGLMEAEYIAPAVKLSPQDAFYAEKKSVELSKAAGEISGEMVMCYPPGIPILAPGELITRDIIDYINYAREKNCNLSGCESPDASVINVIS